MQATLGARRALFTTFLLSLVLGPLQALAAPSNTLYRTFSRRGLDILGLFRDDKNAADTPAFPLGQEEVEALDPYIHYASAAYCRPSVVMAWNCSADCEARDQFTPVDAGGDGVMTQYWYVGYDEELDTVIVAHQGTHLREIIPVLTDLTSVMVHLNTTMFPELPSELRVHKGFHDSHGRSAPHVLAAVEKAMEDYGSASVTIVGHSLGAALALIDSVYLPLHLPAGTTFKTVGLGMPRVGNKAWADYVNVNTKDMTRLNNRKDPVPIVPPTFLGFTHVEGEVHIDDPSGEFFKCPGLESQDEHCEKGDASSILESKVNDHFGPYGKLMIGCGVNEDGVLDEE